MKKSIFYTGFLSVVLVTQLSQKEAVAQVTPEHITQVKTVINSTISDDGKHVAYTVSIPTDPKLDNAPNKAHLYVLDNSTGNITPFFTSSSVSQVSFRPSKGTLTFISRAIGDKTNAVYEMSLTGGEAHKLYSFSSNIANYTWNQDGEHIAFVAIEQGNQPNTPLNYRPTFFEEDYHERNAYTVRITDTEPEAQKINIKGAVYSLQWSPDGTRIAASAAPTASVDDSYMKLSVYIIDVTSKNVVATVKNEGKLSQFVWSPDNKKIALLGAYDLHDPTDGTISIVGVEGGKPQVIDADFKGRYESITWTSNNTIHFRASESTSTGIGTIQPNGQKREYIFKSDIHHITSFSRAANGTISFTANTPTHPSELFTLTASPKSVPIKRTDNNPWLKNLQLGKQEVVKYQARDGKYEIHGMLIYPINYQEGTKIPLITVVHGGPEAHYSNGWLTAYSMPGQMAAAKGYAVFYPNYRGSTGRGVDFTYSSQADLAGAEFDDIVDGIDYLIAKDIADKNKVGVTGGSYGGYASAWMSTYYSDRFAAAVMFVGISNNISKFGTSDIPNEMFLVHSRKRVWDDWQWQLERSPIYHVDRSQTPILIMHGAEDPRVHPAQSMELYRHLKVRKPEIPVRLIYYPGEGHGNARAGSRYDYNLRMMQWFDTYLKTGDRKAQLPNLDLPE